MEMTNIQSTPILKTVDGGRVARPRPISRAAARPTGLTSRTLDFAVITVLGLTSTIAAITQIALALS